MFKKENMLLAIQESKKAIALGEVPVGCVIVDLDGDVISSAHNFTVAGSCAIKHAEMIAIEMATQKKKTPFLYSCELYVTLEPCPMCAYAICLARIKSVYFGCCDLKTGAMGGRMNVYNCGVCNHVPEVYLDVQNPECSSIMRDFFKARR